MKRMFIVGDEPFLVNTMRLALRYASGITLYGVIDGQRDVRRATREALPDIVVVDGSVADRRPATRVQEIRAEAPDALIVLIAASHDVEGLEAILEVGAVICLSRSTGIAQLGSLLQSAPEAAPVAVPVPDAAEPAEEPNPLTNREMEILRAVAEGHTNARIGRELWVTEQTVKFHLSNIYRKLGVSNRTEASRYALVNDLFGTRRAPREPVAAAAVVTGGQDQVNGNGRLGPPSQALRAVGGAR